MVVDLFGINLVGKLSRPLKWLGIIVFAFLMINLTSLAKTSPEADYLNAVGLLRGSESGLALSSSLSRQEAAVMVVRLLGAEAHAIEKNYDHPFTDVDGWASPYVGYLLAQGLTSGISKTEFGAKLPLTQAQYLTFILRGLGYDDGAGEFQWEESYKKAKSIGMQVTDLTGLPFTRDHMAQATYQALSMKVLSDQISLKAKLIRQDVLNPMVETADKIYQYEVAGLSYRPVSQKQLINELVIALYSMANNYEADISRMSGPDVPTALKEATKLLSLVPGYSSVLAGYQVNYSTSKIKVSFTYNNTKDEIDQAKEKARRLVAKLINPAMSDFEKELILHDYLVDFISYDENPPALGSTYTIYGGLTEGEAVCHGYAEAMQVMGYLAGLDIRLVLGDAYVNGKKIGHAWNMITIDGKNYHLDTTWDDPLMPSGQEVVSHTYFNVSDGVMMKDHQWDLKSYPIADATTYNYYVYNKMTVYGLAGLKDRLQRGFDLNEGTITVKVLGPEISLQDVSTVISSCYGYGRITYRLDGTTNVVTVEKVV